MKLNMASVKKGLKIVGLTLKKRAPEILTGLGVGGLFVTTALAVKQTIPATRAVDEVRKEKEHLAADDEVVTMKPMEVIKIAWKFYIPVALSLAASAGCMVAASTTNFKRNAALATAYSLAEASLKEYKDSVKEIVGEKKASEMDGKAAEKEIQKAEITEDKIFRTGNGDMLFLDAWSGRAFYDSMEHVKHAVTEVQRRTLLDYYIDMNDYYDIIGLDRIEGGNSFGWDSEHEQCRVEFGYASVSSMDDRPCCVIRLNPYYMGA